MFLQESQGAFQTHQITLEKIFKNRLPIGFYLAFCLFVIFFPQLPVLIGLDLGIEPACLIIVPCTPLLERLLLYLLQDIRHIFDIILFRSTFILFPKCFQRTFLFILGNIGIENQPRGKNRGQKNQDQVFHNI